MKKQNFFLVALSWLMLFGALTSSMFKRGQYIEPDNVVYDEDKVAYLDQPSYVNDGEEEGGDDTPIEVNTIILHYHNDDGKCGKDTTSTGTSGGRSFYLWANGVKGKEFFPDSVANEGEDMMLTVDLTSDKYSYLAGKTSLLFIIKFRYASERDENWGGQSSDTTLDFHEYAPDENKVVEVWTMHGSGSDIVIYRTEAETKVQGVKTAYFTNWKTIHCINNAPSGISYTLYAFDETYFKRDGKVRANYQRFYAVKEGTANQAEFDITLPYNAHINMVYAIVSLDNASTNGLKKTAYVTYDKLYDDTRFNTYYVYDGNDLGMTYTSEGTTFKVWAPTAGNMTVYLYDVGETADYGGSNKFKAYHMNYTGKGVWSLTIKGDLKGKYYNYFVDNTGGSSEAVDPYATATGVNGLRGYVYDKAETNPEGWDNLPLVWDKVDGYNINNPQDLSIYEVHIQDFTGDESWNGSEKNGTYNAFVEKGTRLADHPDVSTGYDHLNELGVKAVQLLPVFDHDNNELDDEGYNWGYNPLNYNVVEGVYSSDPTNPLTRIREFKNLVLQMSKTDVHTRVIMDVVYNHVSRASSSSFTKLMPKYYFRYNDVTGEYEDGSGCSNEIRSEAYMMRKFIVDSICMWAREYKIKGFRFDLMGLIDIETMKQVKEHLYEIDPDNVVYGEGWASFAGYHGKGVAGASTANVGNYLYESSSSKGYVGGFNDAGRNAVRGGNDQGWGSSSALPGWGFLQKGAEYEGTDLRDEVAKMMWGINSNGIYNPNQSVNYASCHDNWTVFDQLFYTLGDSGQGIAPSYKNVMETSVVAHTLIMASNGLAFMTGGEELFRSKELKTEEERAEVAVTTYENMYGHYVSHNSYNAPLSVNSFKWGNKVSAYGVNTLPYFESFKQAVRLHSTMDKFVYKDPFPYNKTSKGNVIQNISWAGNGKNGTYQGSAGIQVDEYFIFVTGRNWAYIGSNATSWQQLFAFGEWTHGNNSVDLGNYDNNTGGAIVVFKRS